VIRCADWTEPDITAFQIWLRVAPSLRRPATSNSHFDGSTPVRGDNHINLISYAVCEMFRFAAAEGLWSSDRLGVLFETAQVRTRAADRRQASVSLITLRRRHRLRPELSRRRDAPVDVVKALIGACQNSRDVFMLTVLATTGLRRGEVLGLRLSDIHLLPTSTMLGCQEEGPHLHVLPRENSNGARVKNGRPRVVPVSHAFVHAYERYRTERDACRAADDSDFVFVNLFRAPLGEPMKIHALNDLFVRLSRRVGTPVTPHMLRHTFGTEAAQATTLDVVAELLGHADLRSTQTYLHPNTRRQRDAIEAGALSQLLKSEEEPSLVIAPHSSCCRRPTTSNARMVRSTRGSTRRDGMPTGWNCGHRQITRTSGIESVPCIPVTASRGGKPTKGCAPAAPGRGCELADPHSNPSICNRPTGRGGTTRLSRAPSNGTGRVAHARRDRTGCAQTTLTPSRPAARITLRFWPLLNPLKPSADAGWRHAIDRQDLLRT
jgi:integrase/recombinase XerD